MAHLRLGLIITALALSAAIPILSGCAEVMLTHGVALMAKKMGSSNALFACPRGCRPRHSTL